MLEGCLVWLPSRILRECIEEANRRYDLEFGGAFMGYWNARSAVITTLIGPGPGAVHRRHSFEPNQTWQLAEIARHYALSGRRETYLGDWHSHPWASSGDLSWTDRRTLRRIINTPAARAPNPLSLVLYGTEAEREVAVWVAKFKPRPLVWPKLVVEQAVLRLY